MLITRALWRIAVAMPLTESAQVISAGSGTLSARMPGQMPRMPRPLAGAAARAVGGGGGGGGGGRAVLVGGRPGPGRGAVPPLPLRMRRVQLRVDEREQRALRRHGRRREALAHDRVAPARLRRE